MRCCISLPSTLILGTVVMFDAYMAMLIVCHLTTSLPTCKYFFSKSLLCMKLSEVFYLHLKTPQRYNYKSIQHQVGGVWIPSFWKWRPSISVNTFEHQPLSISPICGKFHHKKILTCLLWSNQSLIHPVFSATQPAACLTHPAHIQHPSHSLAWFSCSLLLTISIFPFTKCKI